MVTIRRECNGEMMVRPLNRGGIKEIYIFRRGKGGSRHVIDEDRRVEEVHQVPAARRIETASSG